MPTPCQFECHSNRYLGGFKSARVGRLQDIRQKCGFDYKDSGAKFSKSAEGDVLQHFGEVQKCCSKNVMKLHFEVISNGHVFVYRSNPRPQLIFWISMRRVSKIPSIRELDRQNSSLHIIYQ